MASNKISKEPSGKITIINNTKGIKQFALRIPGNLDPKFNQPPQTELVILKPGANANVDAAIWAQLETRKGGPTALMDAQDLVPMKDAIDQIKPARLVTLLKGLTCYETAKIWCDQTRNPIYKKALEAKLKSMAAYKEEAGNDENDIDKILRSA